MSLRTRLLLATALAIVVLIAVLGGVALRQRAVLTAQLDDQLESLASNFERFARARAATDATQLAERFGNSGREGTPPIGDVFAIILTDGNRSVIAESASQPGLSLSLTTSELESITNPQQPFAADVSGTDGEARAIAIEIDDGTWILAAISTDAIEDAQRQLLVTGAGAVAILIAALGLVMWWVDRLGIRPIVEVTKAAEDVAAGRADRRVSHPPQSTEAGRLGAAFNTMLDERQAIETRQRRFVADASHELRTPLTTLRGYTALHAAGGLKSPAEVDDAMRRINDEAARMSALVDDLLTLAALDEGRPLELSGVDLTQLLNDIAADAHAVQPERNIGVAGIDAGLQADVDVHQLTQALTTIVANALRHTPADATVTFEARAWGGHVSIGITDTGPGIAPHEVTRLFDRFYRADAGRSRDKGGSGLGLSIAKAIVEAHDGEINIDSFVDTGTTVSIRLPVER